MRSPQPLSDEHDLSRFNCSRASLNTWLQERAIENQRNGASRSFVICENDTPRVIGYYCLAQGALGHDSVSSKFRKNMPDPMPVTVLGRLAVDQSFAGLGLGSALLRDAVERAQYAARIVAARGLIVHALDEEAAAFYGKFGFTRSAKLPLLMMLSLVQT
jgi:ribosomal protein S18 acetylase RimI-like enzyme